MHTTKKVIDLEMAQSILAGLRAAGLNACIAGGYARDKFFGIEPKDLDIVVCVNHLPENIGVDKTLEYVEDALVTQFYRDKNVDARYGVAGMYNDHASDRACGVFMFPHHGIDVILYKDCQTCQDVLDSFDFNLNQFWLCDDVTPAYAGSTSLLFDGLVPVRKDASEERCIKVKRKYDDMLPLIKEATLEARLV